MTISYGDTERVNGPGAFRVSVVLAEDLGVSWQHASATCEFLGDMFASHCAKSGQDYTDARHSIIYLVNELLENAIKFRSPGNVAIEGSLEDGNFEVTVTNAASAEVASGFQGLLAEVTTRDPGELLIERIEAEHAGVKVFSLPSVDHPEYGRHIELGVKGDAQATVPAYAALKTGLHDFGASTGPEMVR